MSRAMRRDLVLATMVIAGSVVVYFETYAIRAPVADARLGPASFPRALAIILIGLSLAIAVRSIVVAIRERKRSLQTAGHQSEIPVEEASLKNEKAAALRMGGLLFLSGVFVSSIAFRIHFAFSTILFVLFAVVLLGGVTFRNSVRGLVIGVLLGFAIRMIFTQVLLIDLP